MVVVNNAEGQIEVFSKKANKPSLKKTQKGTHMTPLEGFHLTDDLQFRLNFLHSISNLP